MFGIGIRGKFSIALGCLLAVIVLVGAMAMNQLKDLGESLDVILRENYRSINACHDMNEAIDRMNSMALVSLAGNTPVNADEYISSFTKALDIELANVTISGEGDLARGLIMKFGEYKRIFIMVTDPGVPFDTRKEEYFSTLYPVFMEIKDSARQILEINQKNMIQADETARKKASSGRIHIMAGMAVSALAAFFFIYLMQQWILVPIRKLTESAEEIRKGNLELVLKTDSRDELGQLSEAFNSMAEGLRQFLRVERYGVIRGRRATEEIFKVLPVAIAVTDPEGLIEFATVTAERDFRLCPGKNAADAGPEWLQQMISEAFKNDRMISLDDDGGIVQLFSGNRECFFRPLVIPVKTGFAEPVHAGVAIVIEDVTTLKEQQELKKGVVSTVAHQLKTPLTSLRMSVHLMLDENIGFLNEKQTELMVAARDESERLAGILDDLLDMERIGSGRGFLNIEDADPCVMIRETIDTFSSEARERGLILVDSVTDDLPDVKADPVMIDHVFANLLSNAFKFTLPGGKITVGAEMSSGSYVEFYVSDTGQGIDQKYKDRIFDRFFRAPGQNARSGAGLGLAIVRQIIEAHGGTVNVESMQGKGSIFRFTLPAVQA